MRRHVLFRPVLLLLALCAFAAADAIVKGHHGGTRNAIGSVGAPWALIPFLSAAFLMPRRLIVGALVGAVSTIAALVSYSFVRAVRGFDMGNRHRDASSMLIATFGNRWFLLDALGGAVLGAAGSWLATRQEWKVVAVASHPYSCWNLPHTSSGRSLEVKVLEPWFRIPPFGQSKFSAAAQ